MVLKDASHQRAKKSNETNKTNESRGGGSAGGGSAGEGSAEGGTDQFTILGGLVSFTGGTAPCMSSEVCTRPPKKAFAAFATSTRKNLRRRVESLHVSMPLGTCLGEGPTQLGMRLSRPQPRNASWSASLPLHPCSNDSLRFSFPSALTLPAYPCSR